MSNTGKKPYSESDPYGDLDYVPRQIFDDSEEIAETASRHPSAAKKPKPLTGRVALVFADKEARRIQNHSEIPTSTALLRGKTREEQLETAEVIHSIRRNHLGLVDNQPAVSAQVEINPVPEPQGPQYPPTEVGDQTKLFE